MPARAAIASSVSATASSPTTATWSGASGASKLPGGHVVLQFADQEGLDVAARDFLAGMTDRYAVNLFEQLYIPKPWIGPATV